MKGTRSVLALLLLLGSAVVAQAEYVIKFSHTQASTTAKGRAADFFAEQVNERLAGKVRVEVFPEAALHDDIEVLEALRKSEGESGIMAAPPIGQFVELAGGLGVFGLPFFFDRIEDVHRLVDSPLGEALLQPLEGDGIKGLAIWDEGMKVFSVSGARPLRKPTEDFQGKKLGTRGSEIDKATIESLGGIAREISAADAFSALADGTLDGQESLWSQTYAAKIYDVQDWISVSNHMFQGFVLVTDSRFWNALPQDVQEELTVILAETTAQERTYAAQSAVEDRKRIEDSGSAIVLGLTSSERDEWRKATAAVETRLAAGIGEDLIADVREFLAQPELPIAPSPEASEQPESGQSVQSPEARESAKPDATPGQREASQAQEASAGAERSAETESSAESESAEDSKSPPSPAGSKR